VEIAFGRNAGPIPHGTEAIEFESMTRCGMSPLDDIRQLEHVKFVMKGGQIIRNDTAK
jgi:hypothetical protein